MPHKPCPPLPSPRQLGPEETKPTITLSVDLTLVDDKPLRNGSFHFRDRARSFGVDIRRYAVATVHDECSLVHARLRGGDEV